MIKYKKGQGKTERQKASSSSNPKTLLGLLYPWLGPIGCPETSVTNYQSTLWKCQKSADPITPAAEACNHTIW